MNQLLFTFPIENIDGHFSWSCVMAIMNSATLQIGVHVFQIGIFLVLDQEVRWPENVASLYLMF